MAYKLADLRTEVSFNVEKQQSFNRSNQVELSQVNQLLGRLNAMLPGADHRQSQCTFNDGKFIYFNYLSQLFLR